jgi:hypothetical protein
MRSLSTASLISSILCLNVEMSTSNQAPGPFDIPVAKNAYVNVNVNTNDIDNGISGSGPARRELRGAQHEHDELINADADANVNGGGKTRTQPVTPEEIENNRKLRSERMNERREKAKKIIREHRPDEGQLTRMSPEEIHEVYGQAVKTDPLFEKDNHKWLRGLNLERHLDSSSYLADSTAEYGKCGGVALFEFPPWVFFISSLYIHLHAF